jgi:FkbM family methyltransferase
MRLFSGRYFRRSSLTPWGRFEVYVSPSHYLGVINPRRSLLHKTHARFIERWVGPSDVVWDIGANMGLFALPAALKANRVYAFEPDVEAAHYLLRSLTLGANRKRNNLSVVCLAISDNDGIAELEISKYSRAMNKLRGVGYWNTIEVEALRSVPKFKIDTLLRMLRPPDVIKIDVEGAEMKVLDGAKHTIDSYRPKILIEVPETQCDQVAAYFSAQRYLLFDAENEQPIDRPVWDTVAVPTELV